MAKSRGQPQHEPTKATREVVRLHTMVGTRQEVIAELIGVDPKTLRKYYRAELDTSLAHANSQVGGALYNKAVKGDTSAMIFWLKTRAGFRETKEDAPTQPQAITIQLVDAVKPDANSTS